MFRGMIVTLFAGAVVTGLTSITYAKPVVQSQAQSSFSTRSGESLRGLESRNVSEDYTVFSETTLINEASPISLPDENSESARPAPAISVFGNRIELPGDRSSRNSESQAPRQLRLNDVGVSAGGSSIDSDQILKLQYQLLTPPRQ
jgi:hypothetical protein